MIDIHTHTLPQIDDGPDTWEESLDILRKGVEDGIKGVVCTPHVLDRLDKSVAKEFTQKFKELEKMVINEKLQISLWLGSEIHCHAMMNTDSKVATLNGNGKYLLMELPFGEIPVNMDEKFFHLSLEGVTTILAHPERNAVILRKPQVAYEFVQRGVLIQLNAGSVTGDFGKQVKQVAFEMLNHQMVHFIASDCHSAQGRSMRLSRAYKVVAQRWGRETAERLFETNPHKAVIGEELSPSMPISFDEKQSRLKRIFRL